MTTHVWQVRRKAVALLLTVSLLGVLGACGGGSDSKDAASTPDRSEAGSSPGPLTPPPKTGDPIRDAILSATPDEGSILVDLASNKESTVRKIPVSALTQWEIVELTLVTFPHSARSTAAIDQEGQVVVLDGSPENFATIAKSAQVTSPAQAIELVQAFVATTSDLGQPNYPISSINDIKYYSDMDVDELALKDKVARDHGKAITAPTVTGSAGGWEVVSWWVNDQRLVRHNVSIAADGTFTWDQAVLVKQLPVPVAG